MPEPKLWKKRHLWILTNQQKFQKTRNTSTDVHDAGHTCLWGDDSPVCKLPLCTFRRPSQRYGTADYTFSIAQWQLWKLKNVHFTWTFCLHFIAVSSGWDNKHTKASISHSKESILLKSKLKTLFHTWHGKLRNIDLIIPFKNCNKYNLNRINTSQ